MVGTEVGHSLTNSRLILDDSCEKVVIVKVEKGVDGRRDEAFFWAVEEGERE